MEGRGLVRLHRRRWRDFQTTDGRRPVRDFIDTLPLDDRLVIAAAMHDVRLNGARAARHVQGDVYEVRAFARDRGYRILFATEGRRGQVLLALHVFKKATPRTPPAAIALAHRRLRDWRARGRRTR